MNGFQEGIAFAVGFLRRMAAEANAETPGSRSREYCLTDAAERLHHAAKAAKPEQDDLFETGAAR